jgi:hypothetical protein
VSAAVLVNVIRWRIGGLSNVIPAVAIAQKSFHTD